MIDSRNSVGSKETPENENPNNIIDIVEKLFDFNKPQNNKRLIIATPKQMLQRLLIALVQVKNGSASENLLNETCQIIYYLYRAKAITKKVYNNIMNSISYKHRIDIIFTNSVNSKTFF